MLLLSSSPGTSRRARTTQGPIQAPGAFKPTEIAAGSADGVTGEALSLRELIDQHSASIQDGKKAKAGRLAIIKYKPRSAGEASLKLAYLTSYLIATKSTLTAKEIKLVMANPRGQSR